MTVIEECPSRRCTLARDPPEASIDRRPEVPQAVEDPSLSTHRDLAHLANARPAVVSAMTFSFRVVRS